MNWLLVAASPERVAASEMIEDHFPTRCPQANRKFLRQERFALTVGRRFAQDRCDRTDTTRFDHSAKLFQSSSHLRSDTDACSLLVGGKYEGGPGCGCYVDFDRES